MLPPAPRHNGGPPLDEEEDVNASWRAWHWRRAHKKAWKTPPREIALRRLARAEELGMTYFLRVFTGDTASLTRTALADTQLSDHATFSLHGALLALLRMEHCWHCSVRISRPVMARSCVWHVPSLFFQLASTGLD